VAELQKYFNPTCARSVLEFVHTEQNALCDARYRAATHGTSSATSAVNELLRAHLELYVGYNSTFARRHKLRLIFSQRAIVSSTAQRCGGFSSTSNSEIKARPSVQLRWRYVDIRTAAMVMVATVRTAEARRPCCVLLVASGGRENWTRPLSIARGMSGTS